MSVMRSLSILLAALLVSPVAIAREPTTLPTEMPSTAPAAAEWQTLVERLGDRDPATRAAAREALMQLTREDLPSLAVAARESGPLSPTQRSLLREVVVQVYLAGRHRFVGIGPGYLGITISRSVTMPQPGGAVVQGRLQGYDGVRALEVGDVITAISLPGQADASFQPIDRFERLREVLGRRQPGDWVVARVIRDGAEHDVPLRLGPIPLNPVEDPDGMRAAADYAEGERHWTEEFEPRLRGESPASRPARASR